MVVLDIRLDELLMDRRFSRDPSFEHYWSICRVEYHFKREPPPYSTHGKLPRVHGLIRFRRLFSYTKATGRKLAQRENGSRYMSRFSIMLAQCMAYANLLSSPVVN